MYIMTIDSFLGITPKIYMGKGHSNNIYIQLNQAMQLAEHNA